MNYKIVIFWNQPAALTETFIYNQISNLRRYQAAILGSKWPSGPRIRIDEQIVHLINQGGWRGKLHEVQFKVWGQIPATIRQWLDTWQPALIHAHVVPYGAIAMPIAQRYRLPLLVSVHGSDVTMRDAAIWRSSYMSHRLYLLRRRQLVRTTTRVIVQSHFLHRILIEQHGFDPAQIVCIRHGVDLDRFRPTANPEWGHILYVGRLIELKGLPYLLTALAKLQTDFPALRLTVIGDGPLRSRYEELARQVLGSRVTFMGAQSNTVVQEYLQRAYVFCMPSITMPTGEAESLGVVFLEAMAMGVPPVSFASGGIPEVIRHSETGFLATERNTDELAYYLGLLLEQPALRNKFGEEGRRWVEQEFNLNTQTAKLEALYDEVIAEHIQKSVL
ncbi:MAG: glycosyltransferase [Chloroflexus sp.]|uniref:glycosyltransferase n=1 Tax=Chloroflexus sp. TaxID=1904827 RepID=UPI003D0E7441